MIAEIGQYALLLAMVVALVQAIVPQVGAIKRNMGLMALAEPAAWSQFGLVALSFICLSILFVQSDFSVMTVFQNSHSLKPMIYKISGVWGNHEGSLLLWILILTLFGAAVAGFGRNLPPTLRARVLSVQAMIGVGFLAFIIFTSNPFERVFPTPIDGRGLNPLLQDPALAIHPPFLYLGYVGLSVSFSFAVAALLEGRVDPAWARWVRPWTLAAWASLTAGISLGSYWAYYELGWGGWWFWDPVENASFMPWLAATALLHSAIVVEKRDALKSWTILLAILAFSLSLLGTFLVRSGVLNSVHAFATDPTRGVFVLLFLLIVVGGSLALYALRAPSLKAGGLFQPISREGTLVLNNLLLASACATVLLGTLYPLFLDAVAGEKVSVGPPYFNTVFVPLMTPLVLVLGIGPLLSWKRGDLPGVLSRLKFVMIITGVVAAAAAWYLWAEFLLGIVGLALFAWLSLAILWEWAERIKLGRVGLMNSWQRARGLPRSAYGMMLAHAGVAMLVLGITASEAWQDEKQLVMRPGEVVSIGGFDLTFIGAHNRQGPNYSALTGGFAVVQDGQPVVVLQPESRNFTSPPMETTEAAIRSTLAGDLYTVVGEADGRGGYAVRVYYKPLVVWIWIGTISMILGGCVSLSDRRLRVGAPTRKPAAQPAMSAAMAGGDD